MEEYMEIHVNDPFFNGHYSRNKLLELIDLYEKNGWKLEGNKEFIGYGKSGVGIGKDLPKAEIVAMMKREIKE